MAGASRTKGTAAVAGASALDTAHGGVVERYWNLLDHPFRLTPDPAFVYETEHYREAMARLLYNIIELRGGLSVVTGIAGTGKSTLARGLIEALRPGPYRIAFVINPMMPIGQLLGAILQDFGVQQLPRRKSELLDEFAGVLAALNRKGIEPVIVLDEANALKRGHLEELRLILNFEADNRKLFHMVLFGTPELDRRIGRIPSLDQRITMRARLGALTGDQAVQYVAHRLQLAGADPGVFTRRAVERLSRLAGGVPRRINLLAGGALYVAARSGARSITPSIVELAHKDLEPEE
jgi:general secretion pathway protein A